MDKKKIIWGNIKNSVIDKTLCSLVHTKSPKYRNLPSLNFRVKIFHVTLFSDAHHRPKIFLVQNFRATCTRAYKDGGCLSTRIRSKYPHRNFSYWKSIQVTNFHTVLSVRKYFHSEKRQITVVYTTRCKVFATN